MSILSKVAPLLIVALCAAPAAAIENDFTVSSFTAVALAASPEVQSSYEAFKAADDAYKGQVAAMILPTVAFSAQAYPYGYNPANDYKFQAWHLTRKEVALNTTLDLNVFNSGQDFEK